MRTLQGFNNPTSNPWLSNPGQLPTAKTSKSKYPSAPSLVSEFPELTRLHGALSNESLKHVPNVDRTRKDHAGAKNPSFRSTGSLGLGLRGHDIQHPIMVGRVPVAPPRPSVSLDKAKQTIDSQEITRHAIPIAILLSLLLGPFVPPLLRVVGVIDFVNHPLVFRLLLCGFSVALIWTVGRSILLRLGLRISLHGDAGKRWCRVWIGVPPGCQPPSTGTRSRSLSKGTKGEVPKKVLHQVTEEERALKAALLSGKMVITIERVEAAVHKRPSAVPTHCGFWARLRQKVSPPYLNLRLTTIRIYLPAASWLGFPIPSMPPSPLSRSIHAIVSYIAVNIILPLIRLSITDLKIHLPSASDVSGPLSPGIPGRYDRPIPSPTIRETLVNLFRQSPRDSHLHGGFESALVEYHVARSTLEQVTRKRFMWCVTVQEAVVGSYWDIVEDPIVGGGIQAQTGDSGKEKVVMKRMQLWLFERDDEVDRVLADVGKVELLVANTIVEAVDTIAKESDTKREPMDDLFSNDSSEFDKRSSTSSDELSIASVQSSPQIEENEPQIMPGASIPDLTCASPDRLHRLRITLVASHLCVTVDSSLLLLVKDLSRGSKIGAPAGPKDSRQRKNPLRICGRMYRRFTSMATRAAVAALSDRMFEFKSVQRELVV
ncbi:uncharacterized protein SPPG_07719 [Spizellomyces punctatus DAOM BR117]|uniref:Uncharacterized protein n=1 Tax=Spizellomyces punctatus (strain DAOM BR117) TaxID=645134 RepID=A0A0L0H7L7_SPIPD|nr:uncharacterized protein SPPG_07719 [Spizellomyces punctatus DAOM BR117]KNC96891.1 hypothetical protein SPPG_07719 [Spizellomyces punctatus DAOM BR117]|eukprot:XP_016604931.1 hypothetical protein SPPG_07719 [Spizellomyces punctatus DAOM BR117]